MQPPPPPPPPSISPYPYHHHHQHLRPLRAAADAPHHILPTTTATMETASGGSSDHLDSIFRAVRDQVHRWGDTARWKIELILLSDQQQDRNVSYAIHPRGDRRPEFRHRDPTTHHVNDTRQGSSPHAANTVDLERELQASMERQHYLQSIINSQAEQLQRLEHRQHPQQDINEEIATMRKIYLLTEHEQKQRHNAETLRLQGEIETLAKRMKRITNVLRQIEVMDLSPEVSSVNGQL
ncbi:hypothetical protein BCR43DRAFT_302612 [Syncephalastrum racemosum]|uniref:Uncharacterized protein n=1 Tax=Syncephalastrum racemosum TaxID=13706 RepID=A0A1X2H9Y0_SYNRA|nr:hypothetical protein BCR43DRAFT_302612 [Syncephalastrum racemosum]